MVGRVRGCEGGGRWLGWVWVRGGSFFGVFRFRLVFMWLVWFG